MSVLIHHLRVSDQSLAAVPKRDENPLNIRHQEGSKDGSPEENALESAKASQRRNTHGLRSTSVQPLLL